MGRFTPTNAERLALADEIKTAIGAAETARERSDHAGAIEHLTAAIAGLERAGIRNALTAACLMNRGIHLMELARPADAERSFHGALAIYKESSGDDDGRNTCLMELGIAQLSRGEVGLAEASLLAAEPYFAGLDGCPAKAVFFQNLGNIHETAGRPQAARDATAKANAIYAGTDASLKQRVGGLLQSGNVHRDRGDTRAAERDYQAAIDLLEAAAQPHPELARCWLGLANVNLDRGDPGTAGGILEKAIAAIEQGSGTDFDLALARMNLGAVRISQARGQDAVVLLERAVEYFARESSGSTYAADCEANLGMAYSIIENRVQGLYHLERALTALAKQPGTEYRQATCLLALAANHHHLGAIEQAVDAARRSLAMCRRCPGSTEHVERDCRKILNAHDASEETELSGGEFARRLNDDAGFLAAFRSDPVRLVVDHGLTVADVLQFAQEFKPASTEDMDALLVLLKHVAESGRE